MRCAASGETSRVPRPSLSPRLASRASVSASSAVRAAFRLPDRTISSGSPVSAVSRRSHSTARPRQPAHQVGRAQHGGVAGGARRGLRGEGVPVQQGDPAAAAAHQEVGGGGAEAARPDHDDICIPNHPVPPAPGGAAPPGGGGAALSSPRFVVPREPQGRRQDVSLSPGPGLRPRVGVHDAALEVLERDGERAEERVPAVLERLERAPAVIGASACPGRAPARPGRARRSGAPRPPPTHFSTNGPSPRSTQSRLERNFRRL